MKQLKILVKNNADTATLTVANTAPTLGAQWLQTDVKSEICRILGSTGALTATWTEETGFDLVVLPAWNGSASSEIRVRVYSEEVGGTLNHDTGWLWAAPGPHLAYWDFHQPLNVNNFMIGATQTSVPLPNVSGKRVTIELKDPLRTHLDISRVLIGPTFSPKCNPDYSSSTSNQDMSKQLRAASGDVIIDSGPNIRSMELNLNTIYKEDRHVFSRIMGMGIGRFVFASLTLDHIDVSLAQDWSMYGVLKPSNLTYSSFNQHQTTYSIEEW